MKCTAHRWLSLLSIGLSRGRSWVQLRFHSRLTTLVASNCGTLKNPHTIRKEWGTEFPVLWSGLHPTQKHFAWLLCSAIIHGHLAAARLAPFTCIRLILLSCALRSSNAYPDQTLMAVNWWGLAKNVPTDTMPFFSFVLKSGWLFACDPILLRM